MRTNPIAATSISINRPKITTQFTALLFVIDKQIKNKKKINGGFF
jgi:hypothetical protein